MKTKLKLILACLLCILGATKMMAVTTQTIGDNSTFDITQGTPGGASTPRLENNNTNWGYIKDGSTITYTVSNTQATRYKVTLYNTKYSNNARATFAFMQGNTVVASATVMATGSNYSANDGETDDILPVGDYTLLVTFNCDGSSWVMNFNQLVFTPINDSTPKYKLTTACNPANSGTISVTPSQTLFEEGTSITATATAKPYFAFVNWDDNSTNATRTLTMPGEAKTITANFAAANITIPTSASNKFPLDWGAFSNCEWESKGNVGNVRNNGTATYTVNVAQAGYYKLTVDGSSGADNAKAVFTFKKSGETDKAVTIEVPNSGKWDNYTQYSAEYAQQLNEGEYTLEIKFTSSGSYVMNIKNMQFTVVQDVVLGNMAALTIDGLSSDDYLTDLNGDTHTATITKSLTSLPAIAATFVGSDDPVLLSDGTPTVSGSTLTYTKKVGETTYTLVFTNYMPYEAGANAVTYSATPNNTGFENGNWSDGIVTMNIGGDNRFKGGSNGSCTINIPAYWIVKQVVLGSLEDNYSNVGTLTSMTSEGATVYMPYNNTAKKGAKDYVFNLTGHTAGTPITFSYEGFSQIAFGRITIIYEEAAPVAAPALLNTEITSTEHRNHCVVKMTFDHPVAAAKATVNGNVCKVKNLGSSVISFTVWNLAYNFTNTLTIAAGDLEDKAGNKTTEEITATITVGSYEENVVTSFDYVVSNMAELKAALDAVKNNKKTDARKYIYLKNGTYNANDMRTGDTVDEIKACQLKVGNNVSLIGESRDGVEIIYTPYAEGMGERTIELTYGCYAQDITFNTGIPVGQGRGVALYTSGEHVIINNCRALGGQDTYLTGGSCYWKGGVIQGTTDFIFGSGDYFFDGTEISTLGGPITAAGTAATAEWGYVISGCTIKAGKSGMSDGSYELGRPWQGEPRVAFINTDMKIAPTAAGWGNMGTLATHFKEYNSTKNGTAVSLASRACATSTNQTTAADFQLSAAEAAEFTLVNIFGENDGWLPTEEIPVIKAAQTIAANDYVTFSTDKAVAIPSGIAAFYLEKAENETALLQEIETGYIPANCGVVLKNNDNVEKALVFATTAEAVDAIADNLLVAGPAVAEAGDYVLAQPAGKPLGFYRLNNDGNVPLGKAFLPKSNVTKTNNVPALRVIFNDEATGIESTIINHNSSNQKCYNLAGQKVGADYKGIIIVNGKKTTNK